MSDIPVWRAETEKKRERGREREFLRVMTLFIPCPQATLRTTQGYKAL